MSGSIDTFSLKGITGVPGAKCGYSGGVVVNRFNILSGILHGGIKELNMASNCEENHDSKQECARILNIGSILVILDIKGILNKKDILTKLTLFQLLTTKVKFTTFNQYFDV
jgi:hypothetical protein